MTLRVRGPFHLEATVRLLQRRPENRVDVWGGGRYLRALRIDGRDLVCAVSNAGSIDRPALELEIAPSDASPAARAKAEWLLSRTLGLEQDPGPALELAAGVPGLRSLARALSGVRPPRFPSLFESFCRVVPYQQVSLQAGGAVEARFVERFGRRQETAAGPLWAFPQAADLASARAGSLAGLGLSNTKAAALTNAARLVARSELSEEMLEGLPSDAALRRLDALPGIGPWSAGLILLRGLGRLDVFPGGDVGAARGLGRLLGPGAPLAPLVERFGDARGILYYLALGARLLERGLIHPAPNGGGGSKARRKVGVKRVYEPASSQDGARFLVERLWPRGLRKESLEARRWLKEVAPSDELRRWFHHDPARWAEFERRYFAELDRRPEALAPLREAFRREDLTLLFSARDIERNSAVALREYLTGRGGAYFAGRTSADSSPKR